MWIGRVARIVYFISTNINWLDTTVRISNGKKCSTHGYIVAGAVSFDCVPEDTPIKGAKYWYHNCIALLLMLFSPMHMMDWYNVCCVRVPDTETTVSVVKQYLKWFGFKPEV